MEFRGMKSSEPEMEAGRVGRSWAGGLRLRDKSDGIADRLAKLEVELGGPLMRLDGFVVGLLGGLLSAVWVLVLSLGS